MKPLPAVALSVALAALGLVAIARCDVTEPPSTRDASTDESNTPGPDARTSTVAGERRSRPGAVIGDGEAAPIAVDPRSREPAAAAPNDGPESDVRSAWPIRHAAAASSHAPTKGDPAVAVELAFKALQYVGVDPEAEQLWLRAINDPKTPPGARSDLIEDLNQEGYTDNSRPNAADLQLVLARLELIERLAPYAVDEVNAAAFEEAYKDLLAMYVRLGGQPR